MVYPHGTVTHVYNLSVIDVGSGAVEHFIIVSL